MSLLQILNFWGLFASLLFKSCA
uniref:Uncharacterized protein n=1 Tax=Arundo donax TaxID=35708 RepID=A0A0A9GPT8_ARUDO